MNDLIFSSFLFSKSSAFSSSNLFKSSINSSKFNLSFKSFKSILFRISLKFNAISKKFLGLISIFWKSEGYFSISFLIKKSHKYLFINFIRKEQYNSFEFNNANIFIFKRFISLSNSNDLFFNSIISLFNPKISLLNSNKSNISLASEIQSRIFEALSNFLS